MKFDLNERVEHFREASALIRFITNNTELFRGEKINGIYTPGPICVCGRDSNEMVFETAEEILIEFDTIVMMIEYYFLSDMTIHIMSRDEFHKGEALEIHILGHSEPLINRIPHELEKNDYLKSIDKTIEEVVIERFSHEFEYNCEGDIRPEGGDYFATVIFTTSDKGLLICAQDAIYDGWLFYKIIDRPEVDRLADDSKFHYEKIRINSL